MKLKWGGVHGANVLSRELFGWRRFSNCRQVGAIAGLIGTAYASGENVVEQGITKAWNKMVRYTLIELACMWLYYQPSSELNHWYIRQFGKEGKRFRRIEIVAWTSKLLIALWRYIEFNEVPKRIVVVKWWRYN